MNFIVIAFLLSTSYKKTNTSINQQKKVEALQKLVHIQPELKGKKYTFFQH
uniref:Uncharacterized protein n=1 Tax=Rhizophagus irregularis (strain DAOM 181602 / DAOM 197198 / MUCL 43194) TaxID=747089 RepID=U9URZ7_RHIID